MIEKCIKISGQQLRTVTHTSTCRTMTGVRVRETDCLNSLWLCECVFVWRGQWGEFFFMGGDQKREKCT